MRDLLIEGGRLRDPSAGLDAVGDVLIQGGRIAAVGEVARTGEEQVVEVEGLWVVPGLMDIHVHLREPGGEQKETIATGTAAAAAGGFTVVAAEPNTTPPRDTPERIAEVRELAERTARVRVLHKCCITVDQEGREVTDLAALARAGAAAASDDGFSVRDGEVMAQAFAAARAAEIPLTLHVDGPEMIARDIALSAEYGWPVHFSHVSLEAEVDLIADAQSRGLPVTGEATPHHLTLCAEEAPQGDADFKMAPPLASAADRAALRRALAAGVISVIASDHAPHAPAEKAAPYDQAPFGVIGLETSLGVVWTELVERGLLSAETALAAMTRNPAAVLQIAPPSLEPGGRGDVTVFDPEHEWVVDPDWFQSLSRNCPFAGWRLKGKAIATIAGGRLVFWEGQMMREDGV